MNHLNVLIQVDTNGKRTIEDIVRDLENQGLEIDRVLKRVGVISATVSTSKISDIEAMDGVLSCREDRSVQLPPKGPEFPQ